MSEPGVMQPAGKAVSISALPDAPHSLKQDEHIFLLLIFLGLTSSLVYTFRFLVCFENSLPVILNCICCFDNTFLLYEFHWKEMSFLPSAVKL